MKKKILLLLLVAGLVGCSQTEQVIQKPVERYCPEPPVIYLTPPKTIPELLDNYNIVTGYALELQSTITCYKGGNKDVGKDQRSVEESIR